MKSGWAMLAVVVALLVAGSAVGADVRYETHFPDLPGYRTLPCDFHMHTVFSDGLVWPSVRVKEAWHQGLEAIAISDHIEYQPHKSDVPTSHNRSYEMVQGLAREMDLLLIKGAEITRDTPPGHFNALFLQDITPLDIPDFLEAIKRANEQGAYVFWNHQGWKGEEKGRWMDVHTTMFNNKWFQGMEVANGDEYYPQAHQWCLEKNLTMMGNTDIHDPDLRQKSTSVDHRTLTLVFAKERTPEAIKEALLAGRTTVWYKDQLIGRKEWLQPLFQACVRVKPPHMRTKNAVLVAIENVCEADLRLQRTGKSGPLELTIPARSTVLVKISTSCPKEAMQLSYTATNLLIAPKTSLLVTLEIPGP